MPIPEKDKDILRQLGEKIADITAEEAERFA